MGTQYEIIDVHIFSGLISVFECAAGHCRADDHPFKDNLDSLAFLFTDSVKTGLIRQVKSRLVAGAMRREPLEKLVESTGHIFDKFVKQGGAFYTPPGLEALLRVNLTRATEFVRKAAPGGGPAEHSQNCHCCNIDINNDLHDFSDESGYGLWREIERGFKEIRKEVESEVKEGRKGIEK